MTTNSELSLDRVDALAGMGRIADALQLLEALALAGHVDAMVKLASWLLAGRQVSRDLSRSRALFEAAGRSGRADAAAIHRAFVANGTGAPPDWRQAIELLRAAAGSPPIDRQLRLLEGMDLDEEGGPRVVPGGETLGDRPRVIVFRGFFAADECAYLTSSSEGRFRRATVFDPSSGRQISDPIRSSDVASFPLALEDPVVRALNLRIAAASGTDVRGGEPLTILRYAPGQQYRPHVDALPHGDNQREWTMLVYLNADYLGGETCFLHSGLRVKAGIGDAILFRNVDGAGRPDMTSRHAGEPVTSGIKFVASRWIRARPIVL